MSPLRRELRVAQMGIEGLERTSAYFARENAVSGELASTTQRDVTRPERRAARQ
jgi:hypothetical protein